MTTVRRCLFCRRGDGGFISLEHIFPETIVLRRANPTDGAYMLIDVSTNALASAEHGRLRVTLRTTRWGGARR